MKTAFSVQFGAPYIPVPKGRGFTANPDKIEKEKLKNESDKKEH